MISKKTLALALTFAAATTLAACSGDEAAVTATPQVDATETAARLANLTDPEQQVAEPELQRAIATLRGMLRADPSNHDAQIKLGEVYLKSNLPSDAIKQFTAALTSSEHGALAKQGLGIAFLRLDDADNARKYLSEAVADDANLWRAHLGLAQLADRQRNWMEAEASYKAALAVGPHAAVQNNLGLSYMRQRRYEEAIAQFQASLAVKPDAKVRGNLRFAYAMKGEYLTALAGVSKENMADALNNVGYAAMLRGDYDAAEAYLTRAIEASVTHHRTAADNLQLLKDLRNAKLARVDP